MADLEDRNGRRITWLLEGVIVVMLGIISYLLIQRDAAMQTYMEKNDIAVSQNRVDHQQLRLDFTEFSSGAIGNRFTQADWRREQDRIEQQMKDSHNELRQEIASLERQIQKLASGS